MMLTVSDVVEHAFCSKFTYFISVLGLDQNQGKRGTVKAGRLLHRRHELTNTQYIPTGLSGQKITAITYYSHSLDLVGRIDEAIVSDSDIILIERKYSNDTRIHDTLRVQLGLLAILIEERTGLSVRKAVVIFTKDERTVVECEVDDNMRKYALHMLAETRRVIDVGIMPDANFDTRCTNCCFRNICPVGSLNTGQ